MCRLLVLLTLLLVSSANASEPNEQARIVCDPESAKWVDGRVYRHKNGGTFIIQCIDGEPKKFHLREESAPDEQGGSLPLRL